MKIIKDIPATEKRKRQITVELAEDEKILCLKLSDSYYKLPVTDEIYTGENLAKLRKVEWCSVTQNWVDTFAVIYSSKNKP